MTWRIGELLVQKKLISWNQLQEALSEQEKTKELTGQILIRKGYISENLFFKTLADQYEMRFIQLDKVHINPAAVNLIPGSLAKKYKIMPVEINGDALIIATGSPLNTWPQNEIKQLTGLQEIRSVLCLPSEVEETINTYYENE